MSKTKYKYEILKEDEEDALQTKIVKKNVEVEFTMQELKDHEERVDKYQRELKAKIESDQAVQSNVEEHHKDAVDLVRGLDPIKQNAIFLWLRSEQSLTQHKPQLEEVEKAFSEHNSEVKEIKKQTGWEAPPMVIDVDNKELKVKRKDGDKKQESKNKEG